MQLSHCINYAIRNTIDESMLRQSENLKHNRVLILYPIGDKLLKIVQNNIKITTDRV